MKNSENTTPQRVNPNALKRLALAELITRTGITTATNTTIGNWIAAGCPTNADGTLNAIYVLAWLAAERRKKPEKPAASAIEDLRKAQTEIAAFKLRRMQGEFFDRAEVLGLFEEAAARMRAVFEAVERSHGSAVGKTLRAALHKSFANIEEALNSGKSYHKPA